MHETEERMSQHHHHHHHHHHVRSSTAVAAAEAAAAAAATVAAATTHSQSGAVSSNNGHSKTSSTPRMACEKASRRLRATLFKAERLGVSTSELARLPAAKRIVSQRDHDWMLTVLLLMLMVGGVVIVTLFCTRSRGCSKIEDINLAT